MYEMKAVDMSKHVFYQDVLRALLLIMTTCQVSAVINIFQLKLLRSIMSDMFNMDKILIIIILLV